MPIAYVVMISNYLLRSVAARNMWESRNATAAG